MRKIAVFYLKREAWDKAQFPDLCTDPIRPDEYRLVSLSKGPQTSRINLEDVWTQYQNVFQIVVNTQGLPDRSMVIGDVILVSDGGPWDGYQVASFGFEDISSEMAEALAAMIPEPCKTCGHMPCESAQHRPPGIACAGWKPRKESRRSLPCSKLSINPAKSCYVIQELMRLRDENKQLIRRLADEVSAREFLANAISVTNADNEEMLVIVRGADHACREGITPLEQGREIAALREKLAAYKAARGIKG